MLLLQKHTSDDVVDSPAKSPTGTGRQLLSSPLGGAAGGRNVGGKTTSVVPAAATGTDVISDANKLKVAVAGILW